MVLDPEQMKQTWHPLMVDEQGRMRTTSLFWEVRRDRTDEAEFAPIFTLKSRDHIVGSVTYISLKQIYMSYDHTPGMEYEFAMDVFGSWDHWVKLQKSSIRNEFKQWQEELRIKRKAEAIKAMITASRSDDARGVAAAKYLADEGYTNARRGRPSKEEVTRSLKEEASVHRDLASDMERLGISIVGKG